MNCGRQRKGLGRGSGRSWCFAVGRDNSRLILWRKTARRRERSRLSSSPGRERFGNCRLSLWRQYRRLRQQLPAFSVRIPTSLLSLPTTTKDDRRVLTPRTRLRKVPSRWLLPSESIVGSWRLKGERAGGFHITSNNSRATCPRGGWRLSPSEQPEPSEADGPEQCFATAGTDRIRILLAGRRFGAHRYYRTASCGSTASWTAGASQYRDVRVHGPRNRAGSGRGCGCRCGDLCLPRW